MANWKASDGSLINFELHGDSAGKETLLLLPGLLGSITTQWRPFLAQLENVFRVVLMDYRGHGHSENNATKLDSNQMVEDMLGLMDSVGARTFHVAGYSLGGYLGLILALNAPNRVHTLLMHGSKFYWTKETVESMKEQLDPDILAKKVPAYANQLAQEHGGGRWRALVRQSADLVAGFSQKGLTEGMVARLQTPMLISVGDKDEMVKLPEAHRLSTVLPNAGLLVLPNTKHSFATVQPIPLLPMMQVFHRSATSRR